MTLNGWNLISPKLTIAKKLIISFLLINVLIILTSIVSYRAVTKMIDIQRVFLETNFPAVEVSKSLQVDLSHTISELRGYMILGADKAKGDHS